MFGFVRFWLWFGGGSEPPPPPVVVEPAPAVFLSRPTTGFASAPTSNGFLSRSSR